MFCSERGFDPISPSVNNVLEFLLQLYKKCLSYSSINTHRSALSCFITIDNCDVGQHPVVCRFMKGIYQLRPTQSRYRYIWHVDVVLDYLRSLSDNKSLSLKMLSLKTVTLCALISSQRVQSLHDLCISNMKKFDDCVVFALGKIKQSRPSCKSMFIELKPFPNDINICVVHALEEYLERTESIREGCDKLFLSYLKPHKEASKSTIARWIKTLLGLAGIDTTVFSAHSTRAASASAMKACGVPIGQILQTAGWSSEKTFAKHYDVVIE